MIWRSKEYLPESIVFHVNYLGSDQASVTLNFSRGAGMIIAQYYQVCLTLLKVFYFSFFLFSKSEMAELTLVDLTHQSTIQDESRHATFPDTIRYGG